MTLRCSILISCYNKADHIAASVESALAQTHGAVEVVVVDDGSTDGSMDVLRRYRDVATVISKANGGQASAMNAAFASARGDLVLFLDGDDVLFPDTVERAVEAWRPDLSKLHYRLQKITADGEPIEGALLPPHDELPDGDVRPIVRRFGFYPSPPMSGNVFARLFLDRVMPLAEEPYAAGADTPVIGLAGLLGDVARLEGVGGSYRVLDDSLSQVDVEGMRRRVLADEHYVGLLRRYGSEVGSNGEAAWHARWPQHLKDRLVVSRLGRDGPSTAPMRIAARYVRSVAAWPEYRARTRVAYAMWALGMAGLPRGVLRRIPGLAGSRVSLTSPSAG